MLTTKETLKLIINKATELYQKLILKEERILVHCAAGIHRTGTFAYSLLRMDG